MTGTWESHSLRGPRDRVALREFKTAFERVEPLASGRIAGVGSRLHLELELSDGIGSADSGRFDVAWSTQDDYSIHYTCPNGPDTRWDRHCHEYTTPGDDRHFHPPPNASTTDSDVEESCIRVCQITLVAMTTAKLWRVMYDTGDTSTANTISNPP